MTNWSLCEDRNKYRSKNWQLFGVW